MSVEAILMSSSISTKAKEVRINKDRTTVYIDHYDDGTLVAHFTMKRGDWEAFILSEMSDIR